MYCCFVEMINRSPILRGYFKKQKQTPFLYHLSNVLYSIADGDCSINDFVSYCQLTCEKSIHTFSDLLILVGKQIKEFSDKYFGVKVNNESVPFLDILVTSKASIQQHIINNLPDNESLSPFLFVTITYGEEQSGLVKFSQNIKLTCGRQTQNYILQSILVYNKDKKSYYLAAYDENCNQIWQIIQGCTIEKKQFHEILNYLTDGITNDVPQAFLYKHSEFLSFDEPHFPFQH